MNRRRIYACYSESHRPLVEKHFLPSIPNGFDLVLRRVPQSCPSGIYNTPGWNQAMKHKVELILEAIESECYPFIVSDVDVRFYNLLPEELETLVPLPHQIAYQLNRPIAETGGRPKYCAGFAVIRPCRESYDVYKNVPRLLNTFLTEQEALYTALAEAPTTVATYLPPERFWALTHAPAGPNLAIHHASWVKGTEAKLDQLDAVLKSH